jgi:hypothetical protein
MSREPAPLYASVASATKSSTGSGWSNRHDQGIVSTRVVIVSWTPLPDTADAAADIAAILKTVQFP